MNCSKHAYKLGNMWSEVKNMYSRPKRWVGTQRGQKGAREGILAQKWAAILWHEPCIYSSGAKLQSLKSLHIIPICPHRRHLRSRTNLSCFSASFPATTGPVARKYCSRRWSTREHHGPNEEVAAVRICSILPAFLRLRDRQGTNNTLPAS